MSPAETAQRRVELARVTGREEVAGPFQESVELVVLPDALVLRRGRVLQALRGGRSEKVIPFSAIERVAASGAGVGIRPRSTTEVGPERTLHGTAATTALAAWWATGGRSDARLVGAPASYVGPLGVGRSGFVLGGPAGVVFVPTGWASTVDDTFVRIPLPSLRGARVVSASDVVLVGSYPGELRVDADAAPLSALAEWWARSSSRTGPRGKGRGPFVQPVIWQRGDRQLWRAELTVSGGVWSLAAEGLDPLRLPMGRVELLQVEVSGSAASMTCGIEGQEHTLFPLGGTAVVRRLESMLRAARGETSSATVDPTQWLRLAGAHEEARLFRGAAAEGTLRDVRIEVGSEGLRLRGEPVGGGLATRHLDDGMRVRVSLPLGRGWQHFTAAIRRIDRRPGAQAAAGGVELLLVPIADGPKKGHSRRAFHRVALDGAPAVPMRRQEPARRRVPSERVLRPDAWRRGARPDAGWFQAEQLDLSAGGFSALVDEPLARGDRLRVELPTTEHCPPLVAEVVHSRPSREEPGRILAGFRLLGLTEQHRSLLQREVLRRERDELARRRRAARRDPVGYAPPQASK